VVSHIRPDSPAANSKAIAVGDVLHEVDGKPSYRAHIDLITKMVPGPEGSLVELGFKRGGGPLFRVKMRRHPAVTPSKTYGTAETQTPPETPDEGAGGRRVTWQHPEVVVHGGSTAIESLGRASSTGRGDAQAGQPVYVTVASGS
jgi:hypothetical protein